MLEPVQYEYIRIIVDFGDLRKLNEYSHDGWRVAAVVKNEFLSDGSFWFLLERKILKNSS